VKSGSFLLLVQLSAKMHCMLDRLKLAVSLEQLSDKLFPDVAQTLSTAAAVYRRIAADPTFAARARDAETSFGALVAGQLV